MQISKKNYLNESLTAVNTAVSATARFEKFTQYHLQNPPTGGGDPPNVPLAGSKMGEIETANALI
jgi:hypothetical protein